MSNVLSFTERYRQAGRVVLPIPIGAKATVVPGWADPARTDFLIGDSDNVAWRLDGVVDLDLDALDVIRAARFLLPATGAKSGRPAAGEASHWFYLCLNATYEKFEDPLGKGTLLEVRTGPGHYTVVPPSLMPAARGLPSEPTRWFLDAPPAEMEAGPLRKQAALLAASVLVARELGRHAFGHATRLDFMGTLFRLGVTEREATAAGLAVSLLCENDEVDDVAIVAKSTAARLLAGEREISGGPALAKRMGATGRTIIETISKWLGRSKSMQLEGIPPLTEIGDAEHFARLNAATVRWDWTRGRWLVWAGHRWAPRTDGEVGRLALTAIRDRQREATEIANDDARRAYLKWATAGESRARHDNLAALARELPPISDNGLSWDLDPWLLGCPNGVLDLRTGALRDGVPEDRITMNVSAPYDPSAEAPLWDQTIKEIFQDDKEMIAYFDRFVGYSLTGDCGEEALAVCHGDGANGKGTLMNTLGRAFGDYADDLPFSAFEQEARSSIPNDVAKIVGKRFVTSSETSETKRLNEARIKALTGRDPITARFLHREWFTFQPVAKFWLATNHRPIVQDDSPGFWRRIHLLPFLASFEGKEDRSLKDRLYAEFPGILARAMRGCLEWQHIGLAPPMNVTGASRAWREESDALAPFLDAECVIVTEARVKASIAHSAYLKWAREHGVKDQFGMKAFGVRMRKLFRAEEGRGGVTYLGVGLRAIGGAVAAGDEL